MTGTGIEIDIVDDPTTGDTTMVVALDDRTITVPQSPEWEAIAEAVCGIDDPATQQAALASILMGIIIASGV